MTFILIILVIMLATAGFIFTVNRRALPEKTGPRAFPPPGSALLFTSDAEAEEQIDNRRTMLAERAAGGDIAALTDAHATGDVKLYGEILDALIDARARQGNLRDLVNHIASNNGLRTNARLAEQVIQSWELAPDRRSTIEMVYIAALSDDAGTYEKAVERAVEAWRNGKLSDFKPEELIALVESQYWELASQARSGGAGHVLKRRLADVRRDLVAATSGR
jgi:hypothetical protein